jgi:hypothetical protein
VAEPSNSANRRRAPRYILASKPTDYQGTIDEERIAIDSVYSFSDGGCGFLTETPSPLEAGKLVTSVFMFRPYSNEPFKLRARLVYISEKRIRGKTFYLHGLRFTNPKDPTISMVISTLQSLEKSGQISKQ